MNDAAGPGPLSGGRHLDLGCGGKRRPGFVGVDRYALGAAHVLADLDAPYLPFRDDSFDLVVGYHSLEHVADLMHIMGEVWRVGRPGAQVCIVAPYHTSSLNLANPYHKQAFNEHTPRFWTNARTSGVPPEEWHQPPSGAQWGLASSDHSDPGFDLRCQRIEFFYFADYWGLDAEALRQARRSRLNVCEQLLYHLRVFKPPLTEADASAWSLDLYLPPDLDERRQAVQQSAGGGLLRRLLRRFA